MSTSTPSPVHPIFDTTVVDLPDGAPYGPLEYEAQREMVFGDIASLRERATQSMLERGWTPNAAGGLSAPPVTEEAPVEEPSTEEVPEPKPEPRAPKAVAAKTTKTVKPRSPKGPAAKP